MKKSTWILTAAALIFIHTQTWAQDQAATQSPDNGESQQKVIVDRNFQDIMNLMPSNLKAKVEAAKNNQTQTTQEAPSATGSEDKPPQLENVKTQNHEQLRNLPEDVRQKVEKAIENMDERLRERRMELKELQKD